MKRFLIKPDIDIFEGIIVNKDTDISYKNERVQQEIKELKLKSKIITRDSNGINNYESKTDLTIYLNDGDILLFDENRGYYLPATPMQTIGDVVEDMQALKNLEKE